MSTSHLRLIATVAVIAAAAATGAVTGLIASTPGSMFNVAIGGAAAAGVTISGLVVLLILGKATPAPLPIPVSATPGTHDIDASARATIDQLTSERHTLVTTCIYVRDRSTSQALSDRLGSALTEVGVATIAPVGERFDPTRHEAGGTTPTSDPAQDGVIAVVETLGYNDRTVMLRNPIVTVYQNAGGRQ
ncbi:MAG TPA: nucleotide exchange factor GrpE [Candidatus Stackebrandtia excrementipullorum]|nr:nucleotide exchange factor GrpE [Candidatus Stackebrandtia excrementipullorum]